LKPYKRAYVEISNVCNLKCSFCPEVERDKRLMDAPSFRALAVQIAPLADEVCLHLMGEPLGHPSFDEIVGVCAELGLPVNLTTNGMLLNQQRRKTLLHPIVRQVNISVHSFEANFGEADPRSYLARIFAFTHEALATRPDPYINYRLWDLTEPLGQTDQNARVRELVEREFGVRLSDFAVDLRRKKGYRVTGRLYVNFDSRFEWPSLRGEIRATEGFCHGLTSHFGVHADGTLVPCCLDKEAAVPLGDTRSTPLAELLEGPRAARVRNGFAGGRLVEDLCQRCPFIERFDGKARRRRSQSISGRAGWIASSASSPISPAKMPARPTS
jgi:MoaA/NifB/PqqE/SkfB family radical SAM enzyme